MPSRPVRDGLFALDPPRLLASRCSSCGGYQFPRTDVCGQCGAAPTEPVELDGAGRLWAWTAVTAPPPGYRGEVPYGFGVVELDVGLRVITRLTESDPAQLSDGQPMRLVVVPVGEAEDGDELLSYGFEPA